MSRCPRTGLGSQPANPASPARRRPPARPGRAAPETRPPLLGERARSAAQDRQPCRTEGAVQQQVRRRALRRPAAAPHPDRARTHISRCPRDATRHAPRRTRRAASPPARRAGRRLTHDHEHAAPRGPPARGRAVDVRRPPPPAEPEGEGGPLSGLARTATTSPPMRRARLREIDRPSPVPPKRRVVLESACVNFSNMVSSRSGSIPMPVSTTEPRHRPAPRAPRPPGRTRRSVKRTALPTRFVRIWRTRPGSPTTCRGTPLPAEHQLDVLPGQRGAPAAPARPRWRPAGRRGRSPGRACRPRSSRSRGCRS